jgi:hypothetical protein
MQDNFSDFELVQSLKIVGSPKVTGHKKEPTEGENCLMAVCKAGSAAALRRAGPNFQQKIMGWWAVLLNKKRPTEGVGTAVGRFSDTTSRNV